MPSTYFSTTKKILQENDIKPSKKLGQNFLIDKTVVKKLIKTADFQKNDIILEIGPGTGIITQEIAPFAKKIIAVEKDYKMCEILKKTLKNFGNIQIIQKDILKFEISNIQYPISNYKIIGNLPFYLTSPVIRKFLENKHPPKEMILIIQKEVAQRICAQPPLLRQGYGGQAKMNFLAVCVQFFAKPKIVSYISKKSFWPSPEVDSAILRITPQINTNNKQINKDLFFKIVSAGFSHPRKQLINNLSKKLKLDKSSPSLKNKLELDKQQVEKWLLKNNIKPTQRAESLTINDWIKLTNSF